MDNLLENDAKCKKERPGIVYLSRIPRRMNVKQIRHVFGSFGKVGRVFLKPVGECAILVVTGKMRMCGHCGCDMFIRIVSDGVRVSIKTLFQNYFGTK